MNQTRKLHLLLITICFGIFIFYSDMSFSRGNCWGIFKNKVECEAEYRYNRDAKVCSENAQDLCRKYKNAKGDQYCSCIDRVNRSCMVKIGGWEWMGSSCDWGESSE